MHRPPGWIVIVTAWSAGGLGGCVGVWRPPLQPVESKVPEQVANVSAYLAANRAGRWVYERTELTFGQEPAPTRYTREVTDRRSVEGSLAERTFLPLDAYLARPVPPGSQPAEQTLPQAPLKGGSAIFFELDDPLEPIPPQLEPANAIESTTGMRYYDHRGRRIAQGTLTRRVEIEGTETVQCPAGSFDDCMRVRVDLTIRFPFILVVDWTSYLWLSPTAGEVRRIQRISGWFLIFWFGSAHEYQLLSVDVPPVDTAPGRHPPPAWKRGAMLLSRPIPHPIIDGMIVDYATSRPAE